MKRKHTSYSNKDNQVGHKKRKTFNFTTKKR